MLNFRAFKISRSRVNRFRVVFRRSTRPLARASILFWSNIPKIKIPTKSSHQKIPVKFPTQKNPTIEISTSIPKTPFIFPVTWNPEFSYGIPFLLPPSTVLVPPAKLELPFSRLQGRASNRGGWDFPTTTPVFHFACYIFAKSLLSESLVRAGFCGKGSWTQTGNKIKNRLL